MKLTAVCIVVSALLVACERPQPKLGETTVCKSFSFVASNKADVFEAKKHFYEASLESAVGYSDDLRWGGPAVLQLGLGGRLALSGYRTAAPMSPETPREMTITWFDEGSEYLGRRSTPCTSSGAKEAYDKVKLGFESKWRVTKSIDSSYVPKKSFK